MLKLPPLSRIRKFKLFIHGLLLSSLLTVVALIINDVVSLIIQERVTFVGDLLPSIITLIWMFWAVGLPKYQKGT